MAGLLTALDITNITSTVASSLDQSLPQYRNTGQGTSNDGYGHSTPNWVLLGNLACNVTKPSSTVLESFADIIGSKAAFTLRTLNTADIRKGDRVVLNGVNFLVQNVDKSDSYTFTYDALITAVS